MNNDVCALYYLPLLALLQSGLPEVYFLLATLLITLPPAAATLKYP